MTSSASADRHAGRDEPSRDEPSRDEPLRVDVDTRGVATITLARPQVRNAFDEGLVRALTGATARLTAERRARAVVLTGEGSAFSAGADVAWMRRMRDASEQQNLEDARALEAMLASLDAVPVPTIARVNGPAIGGGAGLVACCDIAVAADSARFAFSEVRLGLVPAVIAPFVVAKVGRAFARAAFVTGERFDAARAADVGLVHEVVGDDAVDEAVERTVARCLRAGPQAVAEAKRLPDRVLGPPDEVRERTAALIARLRTSDEGQEGMAAFLERRAPSWDPRDDRQA